MRKVMISEIFGDADRAEYSDVAVKWVNENCNLKITYGVALNQLDFTNVQLAYGDTITIAMDSNSPLAINQLAVLLVVCAINGVKVELDCGDGIVQSILK